MLDFTRPPRTDPTAIYEYRDGIYAVDLLTAAIVHLDLFTWLSRKPAKISEIREELDLSERPADVLLTLCMANGLVECLSGVFHATDLAKEHLSRDSAWNIIDYYASLGDRPVCRDFLQVLRTGRPANWGGSEENADWHHGMEVENFARSFTAAMDCRGLFLGQSLAAKWNTEGARHVLDIGGGSGVYATALVARHPSLRATVFEKIPVDEICREHLRRRGVENRVKVATGDMFSDPYPMDCDTHLLSNVIHDWDFPEARELLAKSFASLPNKGQIILHEAFLNREKTGPLPVAEYSAILMHSTQGKCYSIGEMEMLLAEAGFQEIRYQDNVINRGFFTARKP